MAAIPDRLEAERLEERGRIPHAHAHPNARFQDTRESGEMER